jgi:hypothetical protein
MKPIKDQYIDLKEGRMSQANFMRNVRMSLPQYFTNVTSFNDTIKILKNKAILTEADTKKAATVDGKTQYANFSELDNANGQEVLIGLDYEMECNPKLTKREAAKIVLKNLNKVPNYYTMYDLSGVAGTKMGVMGDVKLEDYQMKPFSSDNLTDKAMGMKPVKGFERAKASANKARKETNTGVAGVKEFTHTSKRAKGIKGTMDMTGGKMKKVALKESKMAHNVSNSYEFNPQNDITDADYSYDRYTSLEDLTDRLNQHDWDYRNIEDPNAYEAGKKEENELMSLAKSLGQEGIDAFNTARSKHYPSVSPLSFDEPTPFRTNTPSKSNPKLDTLRQQFKEIIRKELKEMLGIGGGDNVTDVDGYMMDTSTNNDLEEAKAGSLSTGDTFKMIDDLGKFVKGEEVTVVSATPDDSGQITLVLSNGSDEDEFYVDRDDEF